MSTVNVLGMDYGASNGRAVIGSFDGERLKLEELHRFPNVPVSISSSIYWNVLSLFDEIKNSLLRARIQSISVSAIGIDTWAIDFGVIDAQGNLLGNPHVYRDSRTNGIADEAFKLLSEYKVFSGTGMHPISICTLFQLIAMKKSEKTILDNAKSLLFMPNLLSYFLTGSISCDATMASASLLYSPFSGSWIGELLDIYQLPDILPEINKSGSIIGSLTKGVMEYTGAGKIPVISVAHHDTASAIAAVPAQSRQDVAYISCGTWSVVGTTIAEPIISQEVLTARFNNEIGYDNEIMFVKNITGLWILQECIREWGMEGYKINYDEMNEAVAKMKLDSFIDVEDPSFAEPGGMVKKVAEYCGRTSQKPPETKEEFYLCIVQSLALKYRDVLRQTEKLTGKSFKRLHIVGGGARNKILCRTTAELAGVEVVAGPAEATVTGNIMAQLIALGEVKDMHQAVEIIERSFNVEIFNR